MVLDRGCLCCQGYFFFSNVVCYLFLSVFVAALGLPCCARVFSRCGEQGLLFVVVWGFLIAVASLVSEHRLPARGLQSLWFPVSRAGAQKPRRTGLVASWHEGSSWVRD